MFGKLLLTIVGLTAALTSATKNPAEDFFLIKMLNGEHLSLAQSPLSLEATHPLIKSLPKDFYASIYLKLYNKLHLTWTDMSISLDVKISASLNQQWNSANFFGI